MLRDRLGKRTLVRGPIAGWTNINGSGAVGSNKVCIDRVVGSLVAGRTLLLINLKKSELGGKCPGRKVRRHRCRKPSACLMDGPKLQHQHASDTIWLLPLIKPRKRRDGAQTTPPHTPHFSHPKSLSP